MSDVSPVKCFECGNLRAPEDVLRVSQYINQFGDSTVTAICDKCLGNVSLLTLKFRRVTDGDHVRFTCTGIKFKD